MKLLFFDLETTGTDYRIHAIHQLSGMIVIDGELKQQFNFKIQPHSEAVISDEALSISGVAEEDFKSYDHTFKVYRDFTNMLGRYVNKFSRSDKFFLCGYNVAAFDCQFLRAWFELNGDKYFGSWFWSHPLDVIVLAGEYLKHDRHQMENFQLKTVAKKCGIAIDETKLHDAMYDVMLTRQVYECVSIKKQTTFF